MVNIASHNRFAQDGFTMVELITVMVIVGILAAIAVPRFFDRGSFDSRGFYDQTISTLRYAQKSAIAKHRYVCIAFTTTTLTMTYGTTTGCVDGNLISPGGSTNVVTAPSGVTLSGYTAFYFNALGGPSAAQGISISGYTTAVITVETETGYVY